MTGDEHLAILKGGHLDTVSFVMGYVEFRINYNIFRALNGVGQTYYWQGSRTTGE